MTTPAVQYHAISRGFAILIETADDPELMARQIVRAASLQLGEIMGRPNAAARLRSLADEIEG